ncbi:MAG TPA: glycosyltransferase 87 family protein [Thermoleophilaceae bacterium]|nr:glycosyltransferase 87 family protein [Thermoleophilaceae bacterium]
MSRRYSQLVPPVLVAGCAAVVLGAMGLLTPAFTDYELEAEPSLHALRAGDWIAFLQHAPAYGGSLVLRAPFALLPGLWGGGDLALFRSMAAPCLLAGVVLAVGLWWRARELGHSRATCWLALLLVAANPLTLRALEIGHPEELLGGVLCVAAALAAGRGHPLAAGVLLGLAIANKPWAVLAVVPVVAMADARRFTLLAGAGATTTVVMLPLALAGGAVQEAAAVARTTSEIFQPWQVWWFLGEHGHVVVGNFGEKPGYRVGPEWLTGMAHPLVVLVPVAISLAFVARLRSGAWHDGLLLLAFAFLLRCVLDPWNVSYYSLPFLLALVAWEVHAERRPPVVSLAATLLCWLTLVSLPSVAHPDVQAAAYLAWTIPLAALMAVRLLGLRVGSPAPSAAPASI